MHTVTFRVTSPMSFKKVDRGFNLWQNGCSSCRMQPACTGYISVEPLYPASVLRPSYFAEGLQLNFSYFDALIAAIEMVYYYIIFVKCLILNSSYFKNKVANCKMIREFLICFRVQNLHFLDYYYYFCNNLGKKNLSLVLTLA